MINEELPAIIKEKLPVCRLCKKLSETVGQWGFCVMCGAIPQTCRRCGATHPLFAYPGPNDTLCKICTGEPPPKAKMWVPGYWKEMEW